MLKRIKKIQDIHQFPRVNQVLVVADVPLLSSLRDHGEDTEIQFMEVVQD